MIAACPKNQKTCSNEDRGKSSETCFLEIPTASCNVQTHNAKSCPSCNGAIISCEKTSMPTKYPTLAPTAPTPPPTPFVCNYTTHRAVCKDNIFGQQNCIESQQLCVKVLNCDPATHTSRCPYYDNVCTRPIECDLKPTPVPTTFPTPPPNFPWENPDSAPPTPAPEAKKCDTSTEYVGCPGGRYYTKISLDPVRYNCETTMTKCFTFESSTAGAFGSEGPSLSQEYAGTQVFGTLDIADLEAQYTQNDLKAALSRAASRMVSDGDGAGSGSSTADSSLVESVIMSVSKDGDKKMVQFALFFASEADAQKLIAATSTDIGKSNFAYQVAASPRLCGGHTAAYAQTCASQITLSHIVIANKDLVADQLASNGGADRPAGGTDAGAVAGAVIACLIAVAVVAVVYRRMNHGYTAMGGHGGDIGWQKTSDPFMPAQSSPYVPESRRGLGTGLGEDQEMDFGAGGGAGAGSGGGGGAIHRVGSGGALKSRGNAMNSPISLADEQGGESPVSVI